MAERFLKLTPEEIYQLAHGASGDAGPPSRTGGESSPDTPETSASPAFLQVPADEPDSFRRIVEMVTGALASELDLPAFEAWRESYESAPEQFDGELLGFWRERV